MTDRDGQGGGGEQHQHNAGVGEPAALAQSLAANLDEHTEILQHLHQIARDQEELIAQGDAATLLIRLDERGRLIERLGALAHELHRLRALWADAAAAAGEDSRRAIDGRLNSVAALAAEILRRDDRDRRALEQSRDEAAARIAGLSAGRAAASAYAGDPAVRIPAGGAPAGARTPARAIPRYRDVTG